MEFLLLLFITMAVESLSQNNELNETNKNNNKKCNKIKIADKYYEKDILWSKIGRPYNLNVYKPTNTLFFSYSVPETYSDVDFELAYYNIDTKDYQTVAGIRGGCTVTIDTANDEIYMGGSDGIYKYNMLTRIADFYKEKGKNIWSLFHKDNLFYISYPDQRLHIEIDGRFATVKEFENFEIDHFFVTSINGDILFANKTGFFKFNSEKFKVETINDMITVRQIVEDNDGNVYICTNLGIWLEGKIEGFQKIMDYKNIHGLTFDRDNNFIISDESNIMRLRPSSSGCDIKDFHW